MAKQLYTNNANAPLSSSVSDVATSLSIGSGFGSFASPTGGDFQMLTISDGVNVEVVKLTGRSGATFTVVRGQEGSTAQAWVAGAATVSARVTAGMLGRLAQNQATGTNAVAYGENTSSSPPVASGTSSVAIGQGATASSNDSIAIGNEPDATGLGAVAIGYLAQATQDSTVAVGRQSSATVTGAVSVGTLARALALKSTAIGYGSYAYGESSSALNDGYVYSELAWNFRGHPAIQRDDWLAGNESSADMTGAEGSFATGFVDLGNIPPWATATVYTDGDVVRPSTDNGYQYALWHGSYDAGSIPNTITTSGSQPSFPTGNYNNVAADAGTSSEWIALDVLSGFPLYLPTNTLFFPTEFGFICFKYASVTAAPFVSIGTAASPNLYVNNQQLTGITGALQIQRFTPLVNSAVAELQFKLNTKATGTNSQFHGRFYAKGLFIQAQG